MAARGEGFSASDRKACDIAADLLTALAYGYDETWIETKQPMRFQVCAGMIEAVRVLRWIASGTGSAT